MEVYEEVEVKMHIFLTSALTYLNDPSRYGWSFPEERAPGTYFMRG